MSRHPASLFLSPLLIILIFSPILCPVGASAAFPLVRQFSRSLHKGGPQTWAVAEDSVGRMYFAGKSGMLIFDSEMWDLYGVDYGSTVRSIHHSNSFGQPRVYAGAYDEFGYFCGNPVTGQLDYSSLRHLLPSNISNIKEIWNIFSVDGSKSIWFQSDDYLLEYDGNALRSIKAPASITASASIDGQIYVALRDIGVAVLKSGRFTPLGQDCVPARSRVVAILPFLGSVMAVTQYDGVYVISKNDTRRLALPFDDFLRDNQVFCAAVFRNYVAFGTVAGGVAIWNAASHQTTYSNIQTGLQNNTVLSAFFDSEGRLWLGLDNGIDMLQVDAPYYSLLGNANLCGAGYFSLKVGDTLYLGTNQGLFAMDYNLDSGPLPPRLSQLAKGQVWDIQQVGDDIFVSTDGGLLVGRGLSFTPVENIPGCWACLPLRQFPGYVLASTYDNFYLLRDDGGRWNNLGHVDGYSDIPGRFFQDREGNLWISHWLKGVYRLQIDPDNRCFTACDFFNTKQGLPSVHYVSVSLIDGIPVFSSDGGISCLDPSRTRIVPHKILSSLFRNISAPMIRKSPASDIWCVSGDALAVASRDASGHTTLDSVSYSSMTDNLIPGFVNLNFLDDGRVIVSSQDGFYLVNSVPYSSRPVNRDVIISRVSASGDSTISYFSGVAPLTDISLPYSNNSLEVRAVLPEYRAPNAVRYSYKLEGYDSEWSPLSTASSKQYTRLPEGHYTLRVKAINSFTHKTSQTSMALTIAPPWFRSIWAKIFYSLLICGFLYFLYRYTRAAMLRTSQKMTREKEQELRQTRLQAQKESLKKDYEIAALKSQQLENDIKHKSEELSNITMNVVKKNEILQDISVRLDRLSGLTSNPDVARHVTRIQNLIKENITREEDWRTFVSTFEGAYGDFANLLQKQYPALTPTELRMCCYLVMGLSSKEIAQLSNISYRSVEMTRYRLRKKLELTRDVSLTSFLHTFQTDHNLPDPSPASHPEE